MTLAIIFGLCVFTVLVLGFALLMQRSSAEAALLEEVTRPVVPGTGQIPRGWSSPVSGATIAKPFTAFRRFFAAAPDPEIVRRLLLAGYRKPHHADMFLGARLAVPAILGLTVAFVVSKNTIVFFVLALILGFFVPDFWLSSAINR